MTLSITKPSTNSRATPARAPSRSFRISSPVSSRAPPDAQLGRTQCEMKPATRLADWIDHFAFPTPVIWSNN